MNPAGLRAARPRTLAAGALVAIAAAWLIQPRPVAAQGPRGRITQGSLMSIREGRFTGECPLKHTDVKAEISGFIARVTVTQDFVNSASDKIEAVYVFPLPQNAAVDDMTLYAGERKVKGVIKRREEARQIYEAARAAGKVAGLLDQERPNIFTQSVANIMPGEKVRITISYVERLKYEDGTYEFVFPMVVGPRYIPGKPIGKQSNGWAFDTDKVPDASRITPVVAPPGMRAGHDISVNVRLDAGVPIDALSSGSHEVAISRDGTSRATIQLKDKDVLPNKDFLLRYDVAGRKIQDTVLAHRGGKGGFFTMILQPPERFASTQVTPKELVFVLDTSGSMSGFPIEKAKEAMRLALQGLHPNDTFNLITFAGDTHVLFPRPVPATAENLARAQAFLASRQGSGGTEMMKAIRAALEGTSEQSHVRVVCFMTDGYVGNEAEIIAEIQRHPNARVFSFGIGSSVNRYLLDKMAEYGRGEVEYVGLKDDGSAAARRFHERVRSPLLTDITVDWAGLPVTEMFPKRIPDLFAAKPIVITGRYTGAAQGKVKIHGKVAGQPVTREIAVSLPASEPKHDVLATLWARTKVDDLMHRVPSGFAVPGETPLPMEAAREEITKLGLDFRIMTQYTSFVAVEEMVVTQGGQPRRVDVPVEIPEGVSYEGIFGEGGAAAGGVVGGMAGGFLPPPAQMRATYSAVSPAVMNAPKVVMERAAMRDEARRPASKLDPGLTGVNLQKLAKQGKVEVRVWLKDTSAATLAHLKQLGFEITLQPKTVRLVIGRIAVEKVKALSELAVVTYVAPAN